MTPPPPPASSEDVANPLLFTPPPRRKQSTHNGRRRTSNATTSDATSAASSPTASVSSVTSPSQIHKTLRGRMDPYPRYSPRKRLSADFSDGTFSGDSGADSPKSEKGGWRIHAAVSGPFLTGPLAQDFASHMEEMKQPRPIKEEQDFSDAGLLLFPVVPSYVAPAITPEVFQASMQPPAQPQPEPVASTEAANYAQPSPNQEAAWGATQETQETYYNNEQQQYQDQYYYNNTGYDQQQYNGYDQQQYNGYEQQQYNGYDQSYYAAPAAEQQAVAPPPPTEDAFPPLQPAETNQNQTSEAPPAVPQRARAPSYAEVVAGSAHPEPAAPAPVEAPATKPPTAKTETKPVKKIKTFDAFNQLSDGLVESMNLILAKTQNAKGSHAEVEFTCLIRRIQTQLKLMNRVSKSLHLEQMKTMHKLQKSDIQKLSMEASNLKMHAMVKTYQEEQDELKKQLQEAIQAKDTRLKNAVDQLTKRIEVLKSSTDASTAKLVSEIDAIRSGTSSDDLEKRVEEIGGVLDYLIENQQQEAKPGSPPPPKVRFGRKQSLTSWKAIALYALIVWAASLCGVFVGVKYSTSTSPATPAVTQPLTLQEADLEVIMARLSETLPAASALTRELEQVTEEELSEIAPVEASEVVEPVAENVWTPEEPVTETVEAVEEPAVETVAEALVETVEEPVEPVEAVVEAPVEAVEAPVEAVEAPVEIEAVVEAVEEPVETVAVEEVVEVATPAPVVEEIQQESCFTSPADHSTLASRFCAMISEVVEETVVEEPVVETETVSEESATADVVEVEVPVVDATPEFPALMTKMMEETKPVQPVEEVVEETVEEAPVEIVEETVAPVEIVEEVAEETPVEVVEQAPVEAVEETVAPVEVDEETPVEVVEEAPVEVVEEAPVEVVEETPVEIIEETVAPVEAIEEVVEQAPVEIVEEFVVEEAPVEIQAVVEEEPTVEEVEPIAAVVEEPVVETPVEETAVETVEALMVSVQETCTALSQALYVWCPSLFDMEPPMAENSSPLHGLARALDSLSTQLLTESEVVVEEPAPVQEEVSVEADDVSGSVIVETDAETESAEEIAVETEPEVVAEPIEEVVAETEPVAIEAEAEPEVVYEPEAVEAEPEVVSEEVVEAEDEAEAEPEVEVVSEEIVEAEPEAVEAEAETEVVQEISRVVYPWEEPSVVVEFASEAAVVQSSRAVLEHFLIEIGALCGTAFDELEEVEELAQVEEIVEDVEEVEALVEEVVASPTCLQESCPLVEIFTHDVVDDVEEAVEEQEEEEEEEEEETEEEEVEEEVVVEEEVAVVEEAEVEAPATCLQETCPLFELFTHASPKSDSNASVDTESTSSELSLDAEGLCDVPVLDLKTQLFTAL